AVSSGLRVNASATPEPSFTRFVAIAAAARVVNGGPHSCGAHRPSRPAPSYCCAIAPSISPGIGVTTPQYFRAFAIGNLLGRTTFERDSTHERRRKKRSHGRAPRRRF